MLKPEDKELFERVVPGNTSHINFMDIRVGHDDLGALLEAARAEGAGTLREALLSEEVVQAAGDAAGRELVDQELSGAFDDLGEDGSNKAIARAAIIAALESIGGDHG